MVALKIGGSEAGAAAAAQRPRWEQVRHTLARPGIALLVLVFFLATFSFACFETTLGLLVSLNFGLKFETIKGVVHVYDDKVVYLYTFCGLVGALDRDVAGVVARRRRLLERRLVLLVDDDKAEVGLWGEDGAAVVIRKYDGCAIYILRGAGAP